MRRLTGLGLNSRVKKRRKYIKIKESLAIKKLNPKIPVFNLQN